MANVKVEEEFRSNWSTHPGEHLEEYIEVQGWSQAEFGRRAGVSPKLISEVINGKNPVTPDTALKFERVLGVKAEIWLGIQLSWDLFQSRQETQMQAPETKSWLSNFPIKELKARNVLPATNDNAILVDGVCSLLGIGDPYAFEKRATAMVGHYRQSKTGVIKQAHVFTWLALGELKARKMVLPAFNREDFIKAVMEIRTLTNQKPEVFEPKMKELCAAAGVALIFEKPISSTKLFGSARWIDGKRNAIIQMSLRMKSNDHFWWTFFHECGHVVLHQGKNFADDQNGDGDGLEDEADQWAEKILYGEGNLENILKSPPRTRKEIKDLARKFDLHPGIIVGMLQHHRLIAFSAYNQLKAKFELRE